ncbi:MAG: hypothetical protein QNK31_06240 [Porticoccus sp.]|nr:hypothetical protein [Porticoccus sp.]
MFSKIVSFFKPELLVKKPHTKNANELLKEATQLKKEKCFIEACEKLKEAYAVADADELTVKDLLRLPMYLQLVGEYDEGWRNISELNAKYTDVFSQAEIANQMRVFLQKALKFKPAIQFSVWSICKDIERDLSNLLNIEELADEIAKMNAEYSFLDDSDKTYKVVGTTKKGNPITDEAYVMFQERIAKNKSIDGIFNHLDKDLKKAQLTLIALPLSEDISHYLNTVKHYKLSEIGNIVNKRVDG